MQVDQARKHPADPRPTGWNRPLTYVIVAAIGVALYAVWYYTGTATLHLENYSMGQSMFYVDNRSACNAPAGGRCIVHLYVWKPHTLSAVTYYGRDQYPTPSHQLYFQRTAEYWYISCGMSGNPQVDCGLFAKPLTPPTY